MYAAGHRSLPYDILLIKHTMVDSKRNTKLNWKVYIILCSDGSLYTGITTDVERRIAQHLAGRGARYFRGHPAHRLVFLEVGHDRASASRREAAIKKLRPIDKHQLIASTGNQIETLGA